MTALHGPKTGLDLPRLEQRGGGLRRGFTSAIAGCAACWLTCATCRIPARRPGRVRRRPVGGSAPDLTAPDGYLTSTELFRKVVSRGGVHAECDGDVPG